MAKIAVELERALATRAANGASGRTTARLLAQGNGWTVSDVVCTFGPHDRPFEEHHSGFSIAIVAAGSFQYRGSTRREARGGELMTPGSLLLGNPGECFECGHEHGAGDRCVSFWYAPEYFERIAADAGVRTANRNFGALRLPPLRSLSTLLAQSCASLAGLSKSEIAWEELGLRLAAQALQLSGGITDGPVSAPHSAVARVTRALRLIEQRPDAPLTVGTLAQEAGLSPYHFLRLFERLTGLTPHQYLLRTRLRAAAVRLAAEPAKVVDIAFDCGFGDISNFNRAFRAEFGVTPRGFRELKTLNTNPHRQH